MTTCPRAETVFYPVRENRHSSTRLRKRALRLREGRAPTWRNRTHENNRAGLNVLVLLVQNFLPRGTVLTLSPEDSTFGPRVRPSVHHKGRSSNNGPRQQVLVPQPTLYAVNVGVHIYLNFKKLFNSLGKFKDDSSQNKFLHMAEPRDRRREKDRIQKTLFEPLDQATPEARVLSLESSIIQSHINLFFFSCSFQLGFCHLQMTGY